MSGYESDIGQIPQGNSVYVFFIVYISKFYHSVSFDSIPIYLLLYCYFVVFYPG